MNSPTAIMGFGGAQFGSKFDSISVSVPSFESIGAQAMREVSATGVLSNKTLAKFRQPAAELARTTGQVGAQVAASLLHMFASDDVAHQVAERASAAPSI